ncbi:hypothetical protein GCM10011611_27630 [Aliidongia dinghuensis]|uniref:DUF1302 family protein n=1 Tax=Aliidongia dinghuensis TaxID=1867774 RepID=A0A8J2YTS9_9PROT|nr:DUF1302 family protein [Aliidongia dinghuensis]GGF20080.1 hypothetical protein GCM10011611_27630 [Aliidongia dinghuensis]
MTARLGTGLAALGLLVTAPLAAAEIDTGTAVDLSWDNSLVLGTMFQPNSGDASDGGGCYLASAYARAFGTGEAGCGRRYGFTSARATWQSELDVAYRGFGLRASGDAWYDPVYDRFATEYAPETAPETAQSAAAPAHQYFILRDGYARDHEVALRDAFLYGTIARDEDQLLSFRLGRHTLLWGESLFFPENGIAAGQAPVDTYLYQPSGYDRANSPFLPVGQGSVSWQPAPGVALAAFYQFEWRRSLIAPYGAYASAAQILTQRDAETIGLTVPGAGPQLFRRAQDQTPGSSDQFGVTVKWTHGEFDYALAALSYNAKEPELYVDPSAGRYRLAYPKGIESFGASIAGPLGDGNFAAELSARRGMPLVNGGILVPPGVAADNNAHALYPLGDTLHAQLSWTTETPPLPGIPGGARWSTEIAANRLLEVTANSTRLIPGRTADAAAFRTMFAPRFFQVLPGLDLTVPVQVGYNFLGLSETDPAMNRGTGDVGIAVTATLRQSWKASLGFTHYFGHSKNDFTPFDPVGARRRLSYYDFFALTIERSF